MLTWEDCPSVERRPDRVSSAWVCRGTRIPLQAIFENLAAGATIRELTEWFQGLEESQVREVLYHQPGCSRRTGLRENTPPHTALLLPQDR